MRLMGRNAFLVVTRNTPTHTHTPRSIFNADFHTLYCPSFHLRFKKDPVAERVIRDVNQVAAKSISAEVRDGMIRSKIAERKKKPSLKTKADIVR